MSSPSLPARAAALLLTAITVTACGPSGPRTGALDRGTPNAHPTCRVHQHVLPSSDYTAGKDSTPVPSSTCSATTRPSTPCPSATTSRPPPRTPPGPVSTTGSPNADPWPVRADPCAQPTIADGDHTALTVRRVTRSAFGTLWGRDVSRLKGSGLGQGV
jgi:hypothetical protein